MQPDLFIEFTDDALVITENGLERLADLLHRPVEPCLWAIAWSYKGIQNGISFHRSHREAKQFAELQIDSKPIGPARLVDVSEWLFGNVKEYGYCWTNLSNFSQAKEYEGPVCKH
jgi:hypothetical protein